MNEVVLRTGQTGSVRMTSECWTVNDVMISNRKSNKADMKQITFNYVYFVLRKQFQTPQVLTSEKAALV